MEIAAVSQPVSTTHAPAAKDFAKGPHFHPFTPTVKSWWAVMAEPSWSVAQTSLEMWQRMAYMPWNLLWSAWQIADSHTAQALRRCESQDNA